MMKKKQQQLKLKRESLLSAELEKEELCSTDRLCRRLDSLALLWVVIEVKKEEHPTQFNVEATRTVGGITTIFSYI